MFYSFKITGTGEKRNAHRILWESQKEKDHWEGQGIGWWTILK
jgi:hypothetical protein